MILTTHRSAVLAVTGWMLTTRAVVGAVVWLSLGAADQPALAPDGHVLESVTQITVTVEQLTGTALGTADVSGLDQAGPGHFVGVIHIGDVGTQAVLLQAHSTTGEFVAELGQVQAWGDDFTPNVDPTEHGLDVPVLAWQEPAYELSVTVTGFGSVTGGMPSYEPAAMAELAAVAQPGWEFVGWTGDIPPGQEQSNPLIIAVELDLSLVAVFRVVVDDGWLLFYFETTAVDLNADEDEDGFSNRDEYENGTDPLDDTLDSFTFDLRAGWNLISIPVQPAPGTGVGDILSDHLAGDAWQWNTFAGAYEQAVALHARVGYWICVTADINGVVVSGQPSVDPALQLYGGWNCVGPAVTFPMWNSGTGIVVVWRWDSDAQRYAKVAVKADLLPGIGYWLYTVSDVLLSPDE